MNYIWSGMMIVSIITALFTGNMEETVNSVFEGAQTAVSTLISFAGTMCFWTGIMKIAEGSGVSDFLCRIISPAIKRLFPNTGEKARYYISMNLTANVLGMGNAATPMGMMAAEELDKENETPQKPSDAMCMLIVLNTTCIQLVPTTIIALRSGAGSLNPASVMIAIWVASAIALAVGLGTAMAVRRCFST